MPEAEVIEEFRLVQDFAVIMAVAGVAIVLFRRFGQPPILGYLLAGLLVGPFTLPLLGLQPPVDNIESIRLLADLGLVLLLFGIGLEFGWQRIRQIGLRVIFIAVIEISFMIALGYEIGTMLGWSGTEAFFLGAALSISSSAIIVKVLRDSGLLFRSQGRLIVGILVVEDFAAVVLLSVLAGVATTGTATIGDIGSLLGKLGLFLISALTLGALFAPRLFNFVARFQSRETLLIVSLALCFGLALVAQKLGLSAAAGAFLIGTIVGDTDQSEELVHTMSPVRDIFAALFFVSMGMLMDLSLLANYIVPALIVAAVFIVGKVIANTVGTFFAGHDGRTSLAVGMGTPQIGEFSLAMIKVDTDRGAVGAFMYPVVAVTTAITTFTYPFIVGSANTAAAILERRSPELFRRYVASLSAWLISLRAALSVEGVFARRTRRSGRVIVVNFGVIVVFITVGTFALGFVPELAESVGLQPSVLGLAISGVVVGLCIPPSVFIWRALQSLTDENLKAAAETAARFDGTIVLSTMRYPLTLLKERIADTASISNFDYVAHGCGVDPAHAFVDMQSLLTELLQVLPKSAVIAAGGIDATNLSHVVGQGVRRAIIGRGMFTQSDPAAAVEKLKTILSQPV